MNEKPSPIPPQIEIPLASEIKPSPAAETRVVLDKEAPEKRETRSFRFYPVRRIPERRAARLAPDPDRDQKEQLREKIRGTERRVIGQRRFGDDDRPEEFKTERYYENLAQDSRDRVQDPQLIEELEEGMRDVIADARKLGIELKRENFPDIKDIYVRESLANRVYDEIEPAGLAYINEMELVRMEDELSRRQVEVHELVHTASKKKVYIDGENYKHISLGLSLETSYSQDADGRLVERPETFNRMNEALTELTAQRIIKAKYGVTKFDSYTMETGFMRALAEDMAERLNGRDEDALANPDITGSEFFGKKIRLREQGAGRKLRHRLDNFRNGLASGFDRATSALLRHTAGFNIKLDKKRLPALSAEERFTSEEILSYFQAGMFNGDRRCLRIIRDIYGKENFGALAHMGSTRGKIQQLAVDFGLDDYAARLQY